MVVLVPSALPARNAGVYWRKHIRPHRKQQFLAFVESGAVLCGTIRRRQRSLALSPVGRNQPQMFTQPQVFLLLMRPCGPSCWELILMEKRLEIELSFRNSDFNPLSWGCLRQRIFRKGPAREERGKWLLIIFVASSGEQWVCSGLVGSKNNVLVWFVCF